ncbi:hypothetical protein J2X02_001498 [Pseudoxanthomonas japonensis]|uniref:FG-GAP repeat domain-containing protein n=1 Tax=Pseudoxanthomonas japonensis TaxID=69284 RepID=UPI0028586065|nr:VCBS repeat-containing protein [Pseudoxanthomonas japonensis]MDR7068681.1 hypothetical protein [Pseudoxanthomonas japonensis]
MDPRKGLALLAAVMLAACNPKSVDTGKVDGAVIDKAHDGATSWTALPAAVAASPGALAFSATATPAYRLQPFRDYGFSGVEMLSVGAGDFTGDGKTDAVFSQKWASLYYIIQKEGDLFNGYEGYGFLAYEWHAYNELVIADFDGNGYPEAAAPALRRPDSEAGTVFSLVGGGPGQGVSMRLSLRTDPDASFDWNVMDFDGDGHLDIVGLMNVVTSSFAEGRAECGREMSCPRLKIMYGDGSGFFPRSAHVKLGVPLSLDSAEVGDINGDYLPDLVLALNSLDGNPGKLVVMHGAAGGAMPMQYLHETPGYARVALGDFNGDRRIDTVVTSGTQPWTQLRLRGADGTFGAPFAFTALRPLPTSTLVADFDGDSLQDLVVLERVPNARDEWGDPVVSLYLQRAGSLTLNSRLPAAELPSKSQTSGLASGDVNGDGCLDLLMAAGASGLHVYRGEGCRPSVPRITQDDSSIMMREGRPGSLARVVGGIPPLRAIRPCDGSKCRETPVEHGPAVRTRQREH